MWQENIHTNPHYTSDTSLNGWYKAGWINAFLLFKPNSDPTVPFLISELNSRLISPSKLFPICSVAQFWWAHANCSLRFLFQADRSGSWCGLLLLYPISFKIYVLTCLQRCSSACLRFNKMLHELFLPLLAQISLSILLWLLASTWHFRP